MRNSIYPFQLPPLPYAYEALEPHFDEKTMRIHHDKHHRAYVDKLNAALKDHPLLHGMPVEELLRDPDRIPEAIRTAVRDNGGGHLNHQLFWTLIGPPGQSGPQGRLLETINSSFDSVESLRAKFNEVAIGHFASGWTFLVADAKKQSLDILSLPNHQLAGGQSQTGGKPRAGSMASTYLRSGIGKMKAESCSSRNANRTLARDQAIRDTAVTTGLPQAQTGFSVALRCSLL